MALQDTDIAPLIGRPPKGEDGELTEMQEAFVTCYVVGNGEGTAAARAAGFAEPNTAAYRLLRLPHVLAAIRREQARRIGAEGLAVGIGTLLQIARDTGQPAGARVQAARSLVDRALGAVGQVAPGGETDPSRMSAADLAALRASLAADVGKLAAVLGEAAGAAAQVVEGTIAPDVAPGSGQKRSK